MKASKIKPLKFRASVGKVNTLAGGGSNIVINITGNQVAAVMELINIRMQPNMFLDIVASPIVVLPKVDHAKQAKEKERAEKAKAQKASRRKQTYPYKKAIAQAGK